MSQEELPILDFDGDDTVNVTAGDLPPGEFPPAPDAELPEGWENLSHRKTHANMTNITECFWTNEGFVLRVHLLLGDREQVDQRQTFPISSNPEDAKRVRVLFKQVYDEPINIEAKILKFLTEPQNIETDENLDKSWRNYFRTLINGLFRR